MEVKFSELPNELIILIFNFLDPEDIKNIYFKFKCFKLCLDDVIKKNNLKNKYYENKITIPGRYIITKSINNTIKEQIVTIDSYYYDIHSNSKIFYYNYGIFGYHEGCAKINCIRELTNKEKELQKNNRIFQLPQQFYHSIPEY